MAAARGQEKSQRRPQGKEKSRKRSDEDSGLGLSARKPRAPTQRPVVRHLPETDNVGGSRKNHHHHHRLPTEQCGCVRGRWTSRVMHTRRLFGSRGTAHDAALCTKSSLILSKLSTACFEVSFWGLVASSTRPPYILESLHLYQLDIETSLGSWQGCKIRSHHLQLDGVLNEAALHPGVLHLYQLKVARFGAIIST